jgi:hypothetical protein
VSSNSRLWSYRNRSFSTKIWSETSSRSRPGSALGTDRPTPRGAKTISECGGERLCAGVLDVALHRRRGYRTRHGGRCRCAEHSDSTDTASWCALYAARRTSCCPVAYHAVRPKATRSGHGTVACTSVDLMREVERAPVGNQLGLLWWNSAGRHVWYSTGTQRVLKRTGAVLELCLIAACGVLCPLRHGVWYTL